MCIDMDVMFYVPNDGMKSKILKLNVYFLVGNNIVYVGVMGPKGPSDEVFIKHLGKNNYQVRQLPTLIH